MIRPRLAALLVLGAAALSLTSCSSTVSLTPAKNANDPACAEVMTAAGFPGSIDGNERRWTDAQATAAWVDDAGRVTVVMSCGVEVPGPSTLPCQTAGGVDWLIDDSEAPNYRFTTFGRDPAVEVYLDSDVVSGRAVLDALGSAVQQLPPTGAVCTERSAS